MAIDTARPQTRRALLAATVGSLAAVVAQALGRPIPARAEGETVKVGGEYWNATSRTYIRNQTNHDQVFVAHSTRQGVGVTGLSANANGVVGSSNVQFGVHGKSASNAGVVGTSTSGHGVIGSSTKGYGAEFSGGRARFDCIQRPHREGRPRVRIRRARSIWTLTACSTSALSAERREDG
jgi:hypothetical protein